MLLGQFNVDKNLLLFKIHFLLYVGGHAAVVTFAPIYAEQLGISATAVGLFMAVCYCTTVVTKTVIGGITDHYQILKKMIIFLVCVSMAAALGLNFIPPPVQSPVNITHEEFFCYRNNLYMTSNNHSKYQLHLENFSSVCLGPWSLCQFASPYCLQRNSTNFISLLHFNSQEILTFCNESGYPKKSSKTCLNNDVIECTDSCFDGSELCTSVKDTNPPLQLALLCLLLSIVYIANGSALSLSDAACYNALGDRIEDYGKIRVWGSLGWGLSVFGAGYLNQVFSKSTKIYSYSSSFYALIVLFTIDLFILKMLCLSNVMTSKSIRKEVGKVLVKPRIILFIVAVYLVGILSGMFGSYFFWYMRTTINANQFILGCTIGIQCFFSEAPFYYFSGWIIKKLGYVNTITMSFLAYGAKYIILSFLTNPWWALPVELLQGPSYGSYYPAMTSYSNLISPEGTEATVQGIVNGVFDGFGAATGSLLGGFFMHNIGGRKTFYWTGLISLLAGITHRLVYLIKNDKSTGSDAKKESTKDDRAKTCTRL